MKQLNIKDLYKICKSEIAKGNGNKKIIVSSDEEGNSFRGLYCGFSTIDPKYKDLYDIIESESTDPDSIIILG